MTDRIDQLVEQFVAGPSWIEDGDTDEDGNPVWSAEIQTIGGYGVVATVHGGSEGEVKARQEVVLDALRAHAVKEHGSGGARMTPLEALRPFAEAVAEWGDEPDDRHPDRATVWEHPLGMCITLGDFRRAAEVYAASAIEAGTAATQCGPEGESAIGEAETPGKDRDDR